ncbi:alanine racemase family [Grosmannia clavigera kw1407]|uniref:Pyridoxal phosphate homeostasis protein n=1 Tax=Grosmannia clavigera (strain kw1407 / UAMH 11150) TaxID=655863 RepID=F0XD39_GROCL|nr:alanine racemase family [Grosmannia clavigera kw1407]EFX04807.1 alanine racemase family [Grosmannia clavigera kw1407]
MGVQDDAAAMRVDPARAAVLAANIQAVQERIAAAAAGRPVRLVAVSKLKPANDIVALHEGPAKQVHFGENYAQELRDKAVLLPRSIQWHFIGGLQSGHCKGLARIPNLWCVSSIDSAKKAKLLEAARAAFVREQQTLSSSSSSSVLPPIHVHVQVNTSGEESKSGCAPGDDTVALCRTIVDECPHLRLLGLMTIGAIARSRATDADAAAAGIENPDFVALREQRDLVQAALPMSTSTTDQPAAGPLELSMGMSDDFVGAITSGSGEVRVGSTIFGLRPPKAEAKLTV